MCRKVMLSTQPNYIQRFIIIGMVHFCIFSAYLTRISTNLSSFEINICITSATLLLTLLVCNLSRFAPTPIYSSMTVQTISLTWSTWITTLTFYAYCHNIHHLLSGTKYTAISHPRGTIYTYWNAICTTLYSS